MKPGLTGSLATAGLLLVHLALWAPTALAVAPGNDDFADREALSGSLPIEVSRSNAGATKEAGESLESFTAAGHSVWFKWQAPSSGWTTIGSCRGAISPVVAIFEGATLESLSKVARVGIVEHSSEGPNCPSVEQEFTIKAIAGTTYAIAVDGNTNPSIEPPATEGEFKLRVESTPPPPNDDFQGATILAGETFGEPGPDRFYRAEAPGYTWGATKEAGEPNHGGNQGGASVWYSWTAPASGTASLSACCSFASERVGVYAGDAVDSLTTVAESEFPPFPASAGETYLIAIDGTFQPGDGAPRMGSFVVRVSMPLPSPPPLPSLSVPPLPPAPDTNPPATTIVKRRLASPKRKAVFGFRSSEPGSSFQCRLDGRPFTACKSPKTYRHLHAGQHTFEVIALDAAGNEDSTPATSRLQVPK